ncbi:MAG: SIS domain-containing protein [Phycisphaeraceae bacterium]|nr:SIS domain-containing protein [Phycisphaeraceae bacterium]
MAAPTPAKQVAPDSPPMAGPLASFERARDALDALIADRAHAANVDRLADVLAERFRAGGKVLACGNGGSACDAMHFCEELTGRFRSDRPPLAAIACVDPGHLTCTANDFGFENVFSRWVEALGRKGDVLVALSTSGNSENVLRAVDAARRAGMSIALLLGRAGGKLRGRGDFEWIVPGEAAERIQELHMLILHVLVESVERRMFGGR